MICDKCGQNYIVRLTLDPVEPKLQPLVLLAK